MEKVVENKVFNRRPPMFSCIRLWKRQQCYKPKIGGGTQVTNKLSSWSSKDQIQYKTMCEISIMWYCSHEHLSSSFEMYLRHEGHEMKLKFMTPRQAKKDQHTLKEKIERESIEKADK